MAASGWSSSRSTKPSERCRGERQERAQGLRQHRRIGLAGERPQAEERLARRVVRIGESPRGAHSRGRLGIGEQLRDLDQRVGTSDAHETEGAHASQLRGRVLAATEHRLQLAMTHAAAEDRRRILAELVQRPRHPDLRATARIRLHGIHQKPVERRGRVGDEHPQAELAAHLCRLRDDVRRPRAQRLAERVDRPGRHRLPAQRADGRERVLERARPRHAAGVYATTAAGVSTARMRAAVLEAIRKPLVVRDMPDPTCLPNGAIIRVEANGICRTDWHLWTGDWTLGRHRAPAARGCSATSSAA